MMINSVLNKNILLIYKDLIQKLGVHNKKINENIFIGEIDDNIINLRNSYQNELNIVISKTNNLSLQTEIIEKTDEHEKAMNLAIKLKNIANIYSDEILNDIKTLEDENSYLINLESSIKSCDSLSQKILRNSINKQISLKDAARRINDLVRYTLILDYDNYKDYLENKLEKLIEIGYEIIEVENHWGKKMYQGINVTLKSPYQIKIEIQFHTLESYVVKEYLNHKYYEISRNYNSSSEEKSLANKIMILNQKLIKTPDNMIEYNYDNVKKNNVKVYSKK